MSPMVAAGSTTARVRLERNRRGFPSPNRGHDNPLFNRRIDVSLK